MVSADLSNSVTQGSSSLWPAIDASGRYVAFLSSATNVVTNSVIGDYHLYIRDVQASATTLVDADTNGVGSSVGPSTVIPTRIGTSPRRFGHTRVRRQSPA